jgi:soluble lytic murein transglycosylase
MERLLFKERWGEALRVAAMAGPDYVKLATARVAVGREAGNAQKLLDAVPPNLREDTSFVYARASLLRRKNKPIDAAQAVTRITRDPAILVDGDEWWVERRILARKLLDINEPRLAYAVARGHGAETPAMKVEAEFHAGWIALRFLNDPITARTHFDAAAEAAMTPISIARAAYWQGRAAEAAGQNAEPLYRKAAEQATTYYGQLARARLGEKDLPIRKPPEANPSPDRQTYARAISYLYEIGERDIALSLFGEIGQRASASDLTVYGDLALQKDDAKALLVLGKAALQRGLPLEVHAFPTNGVPKTTAPSADQVERAMVLAIARQESAFDPRARSGAGAQGLMQLMPATAKTTALRAGMAYDASRLTGDAVYNANIGATHLGDLVGEWRGSYILTFAAYNAGSGNVKKWIQAYGDPRTKEVDPVDWVERIPFTETRNYVQRIMENLQVYRGLLEERSTLLIESDLKRGLRQ